MEQEHYGRGHHPNSLSALARARIPFNRDSAVRAAQRSVESRRQAMYLRSSAAIADLNKALATAGEEDLPPLADKLISMAIHGNRPAMKYLMDLIREIEEEEDPPEPPPLTVTFRYYGDSRDEELMR